MTDPHRVRAAFYLLVVPVLILATLVLGYVNYRQGNERALVQAQHNREQIARLRAADRRINSTLAEVCHGQTVEFGILLAVLVYLREDPKLTDPSAGGRVRDLIAALEGYEADLSQLTACGTIAHP